MARREITICDHCGAEGTLPLDIGKFNDYVMYRVIVFQNNFDLCRGCVETTPLAAIIDKQFPLGKDKQSS